jgi:hypothetical protein
MSIFADWVAKYSETAKILLLSQGQKEAYDLLEKIKFIETHLPGYMQSPTQIDNREMIKFQDTGNEIMALPSTDKAGHGYQATLIIRDEVARHEYARDNFKAVSRAIDAGGKLIELSTANKKAAMASQEGYFQEKSQEFIRRPETKLTKLDSGLELYTNKNIPDMCLVFLGWKLRPVRQEGMTLDEWYNSRIETRYLPEEIEEQYPAKLSDVFKTTAVGAYFEQKALDEMMDDCCKPREQSEYNTYNGMVRYYKLPVAGRLYVLYTDPSGGKHDPFVMGVMDVVTGEMVCSATGVENLTFQINLHDYLSRTYNATNSYEANAMALTFGESLSKLGTPKQAPRRNTFGKIVEGEHGIYVEGKMKREILLPLLQFEIAHRQIIVHDREFIEQAYLVRYEKDRTENIVPYMDKHQNFDWVMMMAGLVKLRKDVPRGTASYTSYKPNKNGKYALAR